MGGTGIASETLPAALVTCGIECIRTLSWCLRCWLCWVMPGLEIPLLGRGVISALVNTQVCLLMCLSPLIHTYSLVTGRAGQGQASPRRESLAQES